MSNMWNELLFLLVSFVVFRGGAAVRVRHDARRLPNAERLKRGVRQATGQFRCAVCNHAGQAGPAVRLTDINPLYRPTSINVTSLQLPM